MHIKPSAAIRQNYNDIAELCKTTGEPVYLTKNGEGDLVVMDIEAFTRREKMLKLREELLAVEEDRLHGAADLMPALQLDHDVRHAAEDALAGEAALRHRDLLEDAVHVREEDVAAPVQHHRGQEHGPVADAETPDLHHVLLFVLQFLRRQIRGHGC